MVGNSQYVGPANLKSEILSDLRNKIDFESNKTIRFKRRFFVFVINLRGRL